MTVDTSLDVVRLSGSIGAEIRGVDLAAISDDVFGQISQVLWHHQVVLIRDQHLEPRAHAEFGKRFGELHTHPAANGVPDNPEILLLRNRGKRKNITQVWHSDVSCEERPPSVSILAARELPAAGGDTMWADQYGAYDRLSDAMKIVLDPLKAVHKGFDLSAVHPVVRTHPETGRKGLYVNGGFTSHFEGMTEEESRPLLEFLISHASQPDLTVRHNWRVGDIFMWDNRCVMHYAIHDYGDEPREMHRVTVRGERPV